MRSATGSSAVRSVLLASTVMVCSCASACDTTGSALEIRQRAAQLYESGDAAAADSCISAALLQVTSQLELLAAQAQALRAFRDARQQSPATMPTGHGCVVGPTGSSVCLPDLAAVKGAEEPSAAEECGSEDAALALLSKQYAAEVKSTSVAAAAAAAPTDSSAESSAALDAFITQSVQRHWWSAAKRAVDVLRAQNVPAGSEARRAVTELRDEAGSLLALMRQTKMDEATISCAVMWAQGVDSIHRRLCHRVPRRGSRRASRHVSRRASRRVPRRVLRRVPRRMPRHGSPCRRLRAASGAELRRASSSSVAIARGHACAAWSPHARARKRALPDRRVAPSCAACRRDIPQSTSSLRGGWMRR